MLTTFMYVSACYFYNNNIQAVFKELAACLVVASSDCRVFGFYRRRVVASLTCASPSYRVPLAKAWLGDANHSVNVPHLNQPLIL